MRRILLFTKDDEPIGELAQADVVALVRTEELNGENSLDIGTSRVLEKGWRVLVEDGQQKWREYVIEGVDATHQDGGKALGKYHATSSMQHDLSGVTVSKMPGVKTPVLAAVALEAALSGTKRWGVGDVTQTTSGGASMYQMTSYEALGVVTEVWGGEAHPQIEVDKTGVVSRKVGLAAQMGKRNVTRRFDYGHDVRSISRKVAEEPTVCRIVPRGKGLETEDGGIERKLTIESVNAGRDYLENASTALLVRLPDGSGGWEYPTRYVDYPSIEDAAELKAQAQKDLDAYTTPKVTYEASVLQLSQAGMDVKGIALGDDVQCVDRKFMDEGLRVQGRVTKLVVNELDEADVAVTIGYLTEDVGSILAKRFASMNASLARMSAIQTGLSTDTQSTKEYLDNIIEHLNEEINAAGGYTYITEGQGIRTYDKAVSDPLVGAEATQVVEVKGGSIRIANSRTSSGDWEWRSVFTSGHIAADMVTAANITTGYIGSPSGNYWNLDTGELRMANTATIGDRTVSALLDDIDETITGVDVQYAENQSTTNPPTSGWQTSAPPWRDGYYIWQRTATTTPEGTSYSAPTCISGRDGADGQDGTSVTILGEYATLADLQAAHPTGSVGDGYLIAGDLYVWNGTAWENVGTIQGPQGPAGANGTDGIGVSAIVEQYYLSTSSTTQTGGSWSTNQPVWSSGKYIWTRSAVTWTDNRTTYTSPVLAKAINGANSTAATAKATADNAKSTADATQTALNTLNTQEGVFNKLTNNGAAQGIYMNGGKLYINADYIKTGSLAASLIKAGIITDKLGNNTWNLDTGVLIANNINANGSLTSTQPTEVTTTTGKYNLRTRILNGAVYLEYKKTTASSWTQAGVVKAIPEGELSGKSMQLLSNTAISVKSGKSSLSVAGTGNGKSANIAYGTDPASELLLQESGAVLLGRDSIKMQATKLRVDGNTKTYSATGNVTIGAGKVELVIMSMKGSNISATKRYTFTISGFK